MNKKEKEKLSCNRYALTTVPERHQNNYYAPIITTIMMTIMTAAKKAQNITEQPIDISQYFAETKTTTSPKVKKQNQDF